MNTLSYFIKVLALLGLTAFATAALSAPAPLIRAESGGLQPIEGVWEFGCGNAAPGQPDENEYLIFLGDTVEGRQLQYTSTDGTCSSGETIVGFDTGSVKVAGEVITEGWIDDQGNPALPPPRQDGNGNLNPAPTVTKLEFELPSGAIELGLYYMDDTAESFCLWRGDGLGTVLGAYEPLCKVDIVIDPRPVCDIQLNQTSFVDGDTIIADVFRFANLTDSPVALEVKIWLELQGLPSFSVANFGSDGSYELPAVTDVDAGPLTLGLVTAAWARGNLEFSCRMLDPTTGELLREDRNFFQIQ